jgi:hypothetical protein
MMIGIVGLTISCMKGQETYIRFKAKYNKKETLRSITLLGEETSILAVDSKEEDEEEEWVEAKEKSFIITAHNQDTLQGIIRTLVPLVTTASRLTMLNKIVMCC